MKQNIGVIDRVIRFIGGLLFVILGLLAIPNRIVQVTFFVLGAIGVLESFFGYCYLYKILGIDTCQKDKRILWKVLAWVFALCGMAAYLTGWVALMNNTSYWVPTEYWFYDAIAAGVFAVFLSSYAYHQEERTTTNKRKVGR